MSHFTVTVRIPSSVALDGLHAAVNAALAPYQENNMGDCPKEFMEFVDADEPELEPGETREQVMKADGCKQHPDDPNRWGYWENPNKKWDWWVVGGRWNGKLPIRADVKPIRGEAGVMGKLETNEQRSDACRISELDRDGIATESRKKLEQAWDQWCRFRESLLDETKKLDGHERFVARDQAFDLGLIECVDFAEATPEKIAGRATKEWKRDNVHRVDILSSIDREKFFEQNRDVFYQTKTYAYLDADGWHEPGRMGWFGCSDATPETRAETARCYIDWLNSGDQNDWIVVVDCHI